MKQIIKILITGGHLTPALATIGELRQRKIPLNLVFVGRVNATETSADKSYEQEEIAKIGVRFYPLVTGRLQRALSFQSFLSLLKIPWGFLQALVYLVKEKPDVIVSFGGYVALPVVVSGWLFRIPIITHEQTSVAGLANSIIARCAKKICLTFPDTIHNFPTEKVVFTGLPLRDNFIHAAEKMDSKKSDSKIIYITGGSTGSESINTVIYDCLTELTKKYTVIHQTGRMSFGKAQEVKLMLSSSAQRHYFIQPYFSGEEVEEIYKTARLVIGRSGANTTVELATLGRIALFIPLPWSGGGEQLKNAQWMEHHGAAKIILQSHLSKELILSTIDFLFANEAEFQKKALQLKGIMPTDGAKRLVDEILSIV